MARKSGQSFVMPDTVEHNRELRPDGTGRIKIFLGFGPGVGKTFAMLDESSRRKKRGADVIVAATEGGKREATDEVLNQFERIPMLVLESGAETLDVQAIITRNPDVVLIDNLNKSNPAGAKNPKRYEDVKEILKAGIVVLTTLDVQNLESLNDQVADLTGIRPTDTLPDTIFQTADEVEMVDLTPRALIHRLERGDIYPLEEGKARPSWMTEATISALREMALREIAERVDGEVEEHRSKESRIEKPFSTHDRVMICLTPTRPSFRMIRRGWRIAHRMNADAVAVFIKEHELSEKEAQIIANDRALAERLGIEYREIPYGPVAQELIKFAKNHSVTHMVIGHTDRSKFQELTRGYILNALTRELKTVDIIVVANEIE